MSEDLRVIIIMVLMLSPIIGKLYLLEYLARRTKTKTKGENKDKNKHCVICGNQHGGLHRSCERCLVMASGVAVKAEVLWCKVCGVGSISRLGIKRRCVCCGD